MSDEYILGQVFITLGVEVLNIEFRDKEITLREFKKGLTHIGID